MVALIFGPATGHAATRYAVPGGAASGSCTTVADSCSFGSAVLAAVSGDTVSVGAGTHTLSGRVTTPAGVTIEGQAGPRPLVLGPDPGPGYGLLDLQGPGTVLSHVDLAFSGASERPLVTLQGGAGGLLRDLVITNSGTNAAVTLYAGTMDTVVVRSTASPFSDVNACSSTLRNVTLTGGAVYGVSAFAGLCGPVVLNVQNSIVSGTSGDFYLDAIVVPERTVTLNVDHSNYGTVTKALSAPDSLYSINASANQDTEPQLVNLTLGDIHQLPGSPTIDAGAASGIGPSDIDGEPRSTGAAPDIGADERPPPGVPSSPPAPPTPPIAPTSDVTDPVISGAKLSRKRFRVGPRATLRASAAARRPAPKGTSFSYTLSERSEVTISFERITRGLRIERRGKRTLSCVRASRANRRTLRRQLSRRAARRRSCRLYRRVGALTRTGVGPGAVKTRFSGRIGTRPLKPAPYRSEIRASDATGNESAPQRLSFTVVERR